MARALRLGLTGGIGSGKSTVATLISALGAAVIDADALARSVTAPGGAAVAPIRAAFGAEMITAEGALDRDRMRALVYADPGAKKQLESIVHPLVGQAIWQQAAAHEAQGQRHIVFDVPLLVESGHWRAQLDWVWVVDCTAQTQIDRVTRRSGLSPQAVQAIIAAQASRPQRLRAADAVLFNDGISREVLQQQVGQLAAGFGLSLAPTTDPAPPA